MSFGFVFLAERRPLKADRSRVAFESIQSPFQGHGKAPSSGRECFTLIYQFGNII
jgi:hypothetical protein